MLHSSLVLVFFAFVFALLNDGTIMLKHVIANVRMIIDICERKWLCSNTWYSFGRTVKISGRIAGLQANI